MLFTNGTIIEASMGQLSNRLKELASSQPDLSIPTPWLRKVLEKYNEKLVPNYEDLTISYKAFPSSGEILRNREGFLVHGYDQGGWNYGVYFTLPLRIVWRFMGIGIDLLNSYLCFYPSIYSACGKSKGDIQSLSGKPEEYTRFLAGVEKHLIEDMTLPHIIAVEIIAIPDVNGKLATRYLTKSEAREEYEHTKENPDPSLVAALIK